MRIVILTCGWILGLIFVLTTENRQPFLWFFPMPLALASVILLWNPPRYRVYGLVSLALTLGGFRASFIPVSSEVAQWNGSGGASIMGTVASSPEHLDGVTRFQLDAEQIERASQTLSTSGMILVSTSPMRDLEMGSRVQVSGALRTPARFDAFDYTSYLARANVYSVISNAAVEILELPSPTPLQGLSQLRARIQAFLQTSIPEPHSSLLSGILLGDDSGIDPELADAFAMTGTAHVLAISGFNMAILGQTLLNLLKLWKPTRRFAVVGAVGGILIYGVFVGANPAVLRAIVMTSLYFVGQNLTRKTYAPASVAFTVLVLSFINPSILWDIGFQLSLAAVLGLALFSPFLERFWIWALRKTPLRRFVPTINGILTPSIAAFLLTTPLIAFYFGRLSLVWLPVNALIAPLQSTILIVGIISALIGLVSPFLGSLLLSIPFVCVGWMVSVIRYFAKLPYADVAFPFDARFILLAMIVLTGWFMLRDARPIWFERLQRALYHRTFLVTALLGSVCVIVLCGAIFVSRPDGKLHIWWLDVGHYNAVLIQTPSGNHILIDGGGNPSRLLTALGDHLPFNKNYLDMLIISQPQMDNLEGLTQVVQRYDPSVVVTQGQPNLHATYQTFQDLISTRSQAIVTAGYTLALDDAVTLEVLSPVEPPSLSTNIDDSALVLRLTYGDISVLFPSHLSVDMQVALMEDQRFTDTTFVQMPAHAGFHTLADGFLETLQPSYVLVQADEANYFGDPNPDTLTQIQTYNPATTVYRTDYSGTIHLQSDGVLMWVETEK